MASLRFAFDYRTRAPRPPLDRYVSLLFHARGTTPYRRERIAPTGSAVALLIFGDPIAQTPDDGAGARVASSEGLLIGPHVRPISNEPLGETHVAGVVASPIGCAAVFGVAPTDVRASVVTLEDAWPEGLALRAELAAIEDPDARLTRLEDALVDRLRPPDPGLERCARAVAMLEAAPTRPIAEIADALGLSHGHLDRELARVVGLTPRRLATLLRMSRLLEALDVRGDVRWAEQAAELGWFDQAHLIRDFKRHTGVTPTRYLAARRAVFGPVDEPGFVPDV